MMTAKQHWLGIRLPWQLQTGSARGEYYTVRVPYLKERLPWLQSDRLVTAAIFRDEHTLEFYDTDLAADIQAMHPFCQFDASSLSLHGLQEIVPFWKTVEALHHGMTGADLALQYWDVFTANAFLARWRQKQAVGWWTIEKGGCGVAIVQDFHCMSDREIHAVAISAAGLSIFRNELRRCSVLADRDRLVCVDIGQADIEWLLRHFDADAAVCVRLAMRFYRLTIFELAAAHELLPF